MHWNVCNRPALVQALFVAFVTAAVIGALYYTRSVNSNADLDKKLMNAVKAAVSPSDIKTVLHVQHLPQSIVNLQLFTVCNATPECSVHTAIGFAAAGKVASKSKLIVHVHIEAEGMTDGPEMVNAECSTVWNPRRSTWSIQLPSTSNPNELSTVAGDFAELEQMPAFDGRDSVQNIVRSIRVSILKTISVHPSSADSVKEACAANRSLLST